MKKNKIDWWDLVHRMAGFSIGVLILLGVFFYINHNTENVPTLMGDNYRVERTSGDANPWMLEIASDENKTSFGCEHNYENWCRQWNKEHNTSVACWKEVDVG